MKAIIVDDEKLALHSLEKVLNGISGVDIIGMYQDPRQVIEVVVRDQPDVLFLDIEMPSMNGMWLAEQLLEIKPLLNVVFVTAYSEYAVKAYELDVLDYIVKPIRHDRVMKTIARIQGTLLAETSNIIQAPAMIRLFRTLQIEYSGQEPELIPWRTNKAQELFAYLLHYSGKLVRKEVLTDILWPNLPQSKTYAHLYTTIYQLRKTLSSLNLGIQITSSNDGYVLEKGDVRVDVNEWELFIMSTPIITNHNIEEARRYMLLNRGSYLQEYDFEWAIDERERQDMLWFQYVVRIADYLMDAEQYAEAISICHAIRERSPYSGYSYYMLMRIHAALGERMKVKEQYHRLSVMLSEQLGEQPEAYISEWYHNWEKLL